MIEGSNNNMCGLSNKTIAIIFINIYCVFDTTDNINAKKALDKNVSFFDLAFSRIAMNLVSAIFFVFCSGESVLSVPFEHTGRLMLRSALLTCG
jgi:hypothetical protein